MSGIQFKVWLRNVTSILRRQNVLPGIALLAVLIAGSTAQAATYIWSGPTSGILDSSANWGGSFAASDTAEWNETTSGPLTLSLTGNAFMNPAAPGINLYLNAAQTDSVTLNSSNGTATMRVNNVTIDPSAGAVHAGQRQPDDHNQRHAWRIQLDQQLDKRRNDRR